jgi:hypothetical protein
MRQEKSEYQQQKSADIAAREKKQDDNGAEQIDDEGKGK